MTETPTEEDIPVEILENHLGRIKVTVGNPPCLPGKCAICGSTSGVFIDIGLELDFYGVIYFCSNCFLEGSLQLGYRSPEMWNKLESRCDKAEERNHMLESENQELRNAMDALSRVRANYDYGNSDRVISGMVESEELSSDSRYSEGSDSISSTGEQGSSEQNDESGYTELQHNDSLNEFLSDSI